MIALFLLLCPVVSAGEYRLGFLYEDGAQPGAQALTAAIDEVNADPTLLTTDTLIHMLNVTGESSRLALQSTVDQLGAGVIGVVATASTSTLGSAAGYRGAPCLSDIP